MADNKGRPKTRNINRVVSALKQKLKEGKSDLEILDELEFKERNTLNKFLLRNGYSLAEIRKECGTRIIESPTLTLKQKISKLETLVYDLCFAYANKDGEYPHGFELDALKEAVGLVSKEDHKSFIQNILKDYEAKQK